MTNTGNSPLAPLYDALQAIAAEAAKHSADCEHAARMAAVYVLDEMPELALKWAEKYKAADQANIDAWARYREASRELDEAKAAAL